MNKNSEKSDKYGVLQSGGTFIVKPCLWKGQKAYGVYCCVVKKFYTKFDTAEKATKAVNQMNRLQTENLVLEGTLKNIDVKGLDIEKTMLQ